MPLALRALLALFIASVLMSQQARAQAPLLAFSIGMGAGVAPLYPGAGDSSLRPRGQFGVTGLQFGTIRHDAPDKPMPGPSRLAPGTGFRGAFDMIEPRAGTGALAGMQDIGRAVEVGVGLHHTASKWQIYADIRYAAIGHHGIRGELGANLIWRSASGQMLHGGPRADFGTARFARSYFGVTDQEVLDGAAFPAFRPGGGVHSVGFELGAYQPLSPDWGITGALRFDRLRGDAAASPLVHHGNRGQLASEIGLTRHFNLRF
jgi:MipA family protein